MSRIDVKSPGGCPVTLVCPEDGDHSHLTCDECGAVDFTGSCQTCITLRSVTVPAMARGWLEGPKRGA